MSIHRFDITRGCRVTWYGIDMFVERVLNDRLSGIVDDFRLLFSYTPSMFLVPDSPLCNFAVRCKCCRESIPAPVLTMPDTWIVADCPLCGERRAYLPSDIFRGRLSHRLTRKPARLERRI